MKNQYYFMHQIITYLTGLQQEVNLNFLLNLEKLKVKILKILKIGEPTI